MDLNSIAREQKENLEKFFSNEKIIELIYKEQYGEAYYEANKDTCQNNFKEIMRNTVFVPFITMEHLENYLISARNNLGMQYLEKNYSNELEALRNNYDAIIKLKNNLEAIYKNFGANYLKENYANESATLKQWIDLEEKLISIRDEAGMEHINQVYSEEVNLLKNLQYKKKDIIKDYSAFMLDELKQLYPKLPQNEYDKMLEECTNSSFDDNAALFKKVLSKNRVGLFQKHKHKKIENCINKYKKLVKDKLKMEKGKDKIIIKNYSAFMLDELKQFYPELPQKEYEKILKKCSNSSFEENIALIQDLLPKDKPGLLERFQQKKTEESAEKCIEKYRKLVEDKVLMETSSYFQHTLDVPTDKYHQSILDAMKNCSSSKTSNVYQKIGKQSDKNIRYVFLPILLYNNKKDYIISALHEVGHISKEIIYENRYKTGLEERYMDNNPKKSSLFIKGYKSIFDSIKWLRFVKKHSLPKVQENYNPGLRNFGYRRTI